MTHQYSTHEIHFEWPKTPNDQITIHFTFKWLQIPNYHMKFPFQNIYLKVTWKTKWLWNTWWLQKNLSLGGYIQILSRMTIHWKIRKENYQKKPELPKNTKWLCQNINMFQFFSNHIYFHFVFYLNRYQNPYISKYFIKEFVLNLIW